MERSDRTLQCDLLGPRGRVSLPNFGSARVFPHPPRSVPPRFFEMNFFLSCPTPHPVRTLAMQGSVMDDNICGRGNFGPQKKTGFLPKPAIASGREALLGHRSGGPRRSPPATTTAATKTASRRVLFPCTQSNVHASSVVGILLTENGFGCAWSQKARKGHPSYWVWGCIVKASTRKHKTKG